MNHFIKILFIVLIISHTKNIAFSQSLSYGFNIGGNIAYQSVSGTETENTKNRYGFMGGLFSEISFGKIFKVSPEINILSKGSTIQHNIDSNTVSEIPTKIYIISIPINFKFGLYLKRDFFSYILAGIRVDIPFDKNENDVNGLYRNVNNIDYGACIGLGFTFYRPNYDIGIIGFEIRYNPDFSKYSVDKYSYKGVTNYFAPGTKFRNESLELLLKLGFY